MGTSPYAVMKMIGISMFAAASSRWKSRPLCPGSLTSSTRQVGPSGRPDFKNSGSDASALTCRPTDLSKLPSASLISGSSSTITTQGCGSVMGPSCHHSKRNFQRSAPVALTGAHDALSRSYPQGGGALYEGIMALSPRTSVGTPAKQRWRRCSVLLSHDMQEADLPAKTLITI